MTKQEKTRGHINQQIELAIVGVAVNVGINPDGDWGGLIREARKEIIKMLHSQGMVLKVERDNQDCVCCTGTGMIGGAGINDCCPDCNGTGKVFCVGYVAVEPLIKDQPTS